MAATSGTSASASTSAAAGSVHKGQGSSSSLMLSSGVPRSHAQVRGGGGGGGSGSGGGGAGSSVRPKRSKHSVHWFRKGLRLSDNPALLRAVRNCDTWRCIFILDPWFAGSSNQGVNKWRFLLQSLEDLDQSLRKLDSRLFVVRGQPADVLPDLFREWGTTYFTFEEDPEPFGRNRDRNIVALCKEQGIHVIQESSHTLYNSEKIIEQTGGKPPLTYRQFLKVVATLKTPPNPAPSICSRLIGHGITPLSEDHDERWAVPSLSELGFETDNLKPPVWQGGETEALSRLERHLERKAWVAYLGRPKMTPQSLLPSQTGLSPYLRFGCLSTRLFYHALRDLYKKMKKSEPPLSLYGQLLWREFFYAASTRNPNFDRMIGNPICVQIPWEKNNEALAKWASGKTGFPWIDAIMTQLREEGWVHHLSRHAVACFLTRGHLWISWEEGMKVFDELLLDTDWSFNAGTWMWLSCSSFFQQFLNLYCPVKFGKKADPNGDYIRRYLPVLKNYPTRYIHEPWTAPEQVQKAAKCIVGVQYPKPMVDHVAAASINHERMKQIYQQLSSYRNAKSIEKMKPGGAATPGQGGRDSFTPISMIDQIVVPGPKDEPGSISQHFGGGGEAGSGTSRGGAGGGGGGAGGPTLLLQPQQQQQQQPPVNIKLDPMGGEGAEQQERSEGDGGGALPERVGGGGVAGSDVDFLIPSIDSFQP